MSTQATPPPAQHDLPIVETEVLVVGAGPTGLTAAALLAREGIDVIAVSKWRSTAPTPRAHITNQRAMEVFRDLQIEPEVVAQAVPNELMGDNVWATSFAGTELARRKAWGTDVSRQADYAAASPTAMCNIGQHLLEPILLDSARAHDADVRFETELVGIDQDADRVYARVRGGDGQEYIIAARYAIGADGGRSLVAQECGIEMEGPTGLGHAVNVWFEADLSRYRAHRPGALFFALQPGRDFWLGSGTFITVRPWNEWVLIVMYDPKVEQIDLSVEAMTTRARKIIGDPDIDITVKDISQWQINHVLASRYRQGRVFLAGDAAHRHPPANGLGSNTCVQDSYNLAWKLAMVLRGKAAESLLDTYEQERRPVGRQVIDRAMDSVGLLGKLTPAFGISAGQTDEEGDAAIADFFAATPVGAQRRADVQAVLDENDYQFNAHGVELNQRYRSAAIVPDGRPEPPVVRDLELFHEPTSRPGAKVPHVWLERDGVPISTLDLGGYDRFTLITGIGGGAWQQAAEEVARDLDVPLDTRLVGPGQPDDDVLSAWRRACGVTESGCVLIRPDRYVAWRADAVPADPAAQLRAVMGSILGRPDGDPSTISRNESPDTLDTPRTFTPGAVLTSSTGAAGDPIGAGVGAGERKEH